MKVISFLLNQKEPVIEAQSSRDLKLIFETLFESASEPYNVSKLLYGSESISNVFQK